MSGVKGKIIEMCEKGPPDLWEELARECLEYMTEEDVSVMNDCAGFIVGENDESEEVIE